jgi:hypothetical protein
LRTAIAETRRKFDQDFREGAVRLVRGEREADVGEAHTFVVLERSLAPVGCSGWSGVLFRGLLESRDTALITTSAA